MSSNRKIKCISVLAVLSTLLLIALLIPVIWVSKYAYPWADDFSYASEARAVFVSTHNVLKTIAMAFSTMKDSYLTWQGTYTSCFLMALQPAVFSIKLYHLTGVFMLGSILISYYVLVTVLFNKVFKASESAKWLIYVFTVMLSIEGVDGKAEAFTWYNSAVHYTFGHALFVLFIALVIYYVHDLRNSSKKILHCVLISLIGFLAAGTNNVTVFGGLLTIVILAAMGFLYELVFGEKKYDGLLSALPMGIVYIIGTAVNLGAVGNSKRMVTAGSHNNSVFITVRNSFVLGTEFIKRHFWGMTVAYILIMVAVIWYAFVKENALEGVSFKFRLPGLVTLASYCLLCALYAPFAYLGEAQVSLPYIDENLNVLRVANDVYLEFILLLFVNVLYYCGWLYQKGVRAYTPIFNICVAVVSVILVVTSYRALTVDNQSKFLTGSAIHSIQNGTAEYYGYQMALNIQKLETEDEVVYVSPIAVDPDCLFPHGAADWKEGTRVFYGKEAVEYDSEPYTF